MSEPSSQVGNCKGNLCLDCKHRYVALKVSPCLGLLSPVSFLEAASVVLCPSDGYKTPPSPGDQCPEPPVVSGLKAVVFYVIGPSHVKEGKLGPTVAPGYKQHIQQALKYFSIN